MKEKIDEWKKTAYRLFEQGDFQGSYALCRDLIPGSADPAVSILCATNLFQMGRLDEAEACFRDLIHTIPGSSYVHSYLGRILEQKGDDRALGEFARAVTLDPGNLEALRSYATYVISSGDPLKAVPVLRHLAARSGRADDAMLLVRALRLAGMPGEALKVRSGALSCGMPVERELIEVLSACGKYSEMAKYASEEFDRSGDPRYARWYLEALSRSDPDAAPAEYERILSIKDDPGIRLDYVRLRKSRGEWTTCLKVLGPLLSSGKVEPGHLLEECEILAAMGNRGEAEDHYRRLLDRELETLGDMEFLTGLLTSYRTFLRTHYPKQEAERLLLARLASRPEVSCLIAVASFYDEIGDHSEARSWYYRAFRSDFLTGGPEYARFCEQQGDIRECEKVMLYVINSIRKNRDLVRVAGMVMEDGRLLSRMPRLIERLRERLGERAAGLTSRGLEYLSLALFVSASHALKSGDFASCKRSCLEGLDHIPPGSSRIHPEDFLTLLQECKARSLCDIPVLAVALPQETVGQAGKAEPETVLDLDEQEKKIIDFLKDHHQASEMDLRLLLGTRRVVGLVNRIIQKASMHGFTIIEKRGVGKDGEIYAYRRT